MTQKPKLKRILIVSLVIFSLALGACQPSATPTPSELEIQQQVAGTQAARATENSVETLIARVTELSQPTWTPMPTCAPPPAATQPAPTAIMSTPDGTATATTAPAAVVPSTQCLQFDLISDVNYPPGTVVKPGTKFDKTWTVRNTGTCEWTHEFDLILSGGEDFGTNKRADFPNQTVYPGDTVELTIANLVAPQTAGTYYSYWMITEPGGARFGYGPDRSWGLGIQIVVSND